jgi:hypothetical protein
MRDFVVGDYVIFFLEDFSSEKIIPIKGVIDKYEDGKITMTSDDYGYYKNTSECFSLDYERIRDEKIDTILV